MHKGGYEMSLRECLLDQLAPCAARCSENKNVHI
jgi:hypothetical protein